MRVYWKSWFEMMQKFSSFICIYAIRSVALASPAGHVWETDVINCVIFYKDCWIADIFQLHQIICGCRRSESHNCGKKTAFFNTAWSKYIKATYVYISLVCLFFIFTNVRSKVIYLQQNLVIWRSFQLKGLCNKNKKSFEMTWTQTNCAPTDKSDR